MLLKFINMTNIFVNLNIEINNYSVALFVGP